MKKILLATLLVPALAHADASLLTHANCTGTIEGQTVHFELLADLETLACAENPPASVAAVLIDDQMGERSHSGILGQLSVDSLQFVAKVGGETATLRFASNYVPGTSAATLVTGDESYALNCTLMEYQFDCSEYRRNP